VIPDNPNWTPPATGPDPPGMDAPNTRVGVANPCDVYTIPFTSFPNEPVGPINTVPAPIYISFIRDPSVPIEKVSD